MSLPDEQLHFWGELYRANPAISRAGVSFEAFLQAPSEILLSLVFTRAQLRAQPIHAASDRVRLTSDDLARFERCLDRRLEHARSDVGVVRDWIEIRCGRPVEKLRHRAWRRGVSAFFFRARA